MPLLAEDSKTVSDIFKSSNANQIVMDIEAALARAQASQGIIPLWAAEEITKKAEIKYMPNKEVSKDCLLYTSDAADE